MFDKGKTNKACLKMLGYHELPALPAGNVALTDRKESNAIPPSQRTGLVKLSYTHSHGWWWHQQDLFLMIRQMNFTQNLSLEIQKIWTLFFFVPKTLLYNTLSIQALLWLCESYRIEAQVLRVICILTQCFAETCLSTKCLK